MGEPINPSGERAPISPQTKSGVATPKFPSEEILRQAVAALLTRIPGVSGVQITHGSQEYGKDIVFYLPGILENILCACVVKNTRITGDVASSVGARTVYFQVEQAFDTPVDTPSGPPCSVERVYVVTPYPLSPGVVKSISGKLRSPSGNIVFLDGVKLFDLFKKYWPEYLSQESLFIDQFLKHSAETLGRDQGLLGVAFQYGLGDADHTFSKIYVKPRFWRRLIPFDLGHLFTSPIVDETEPLRALSTKGSRAVISKLESMAKATDQLASWDLIDSDTSTKALAVIEDAVSFFRNPLGGDQHGRVQVEIDDLGVYPWASCRIVRASRAFQSAISNALLPFSRLLRQANEHLILQPPTTISELASSELQYARVLNDFYQVAPSGSLATLGDSSSTITFGPDVLQERLSSLLIVAGAGYGKSSFCRWHALMDSERYTTGHSDTLPVYIPLHTLARGGLATFEDTYLKAVGHSVLASADADAWHTSNSRIRLYLDGLDEIPYEARRRQLMEILRHGLQSHSHIEAVVTARDYIVTHWLSWMPRITLSEFDDEQIDELVSKWLTSSGRTPEGFRHELIRLPALRVLMRIPLLATLVILVYKQTGRLPESRVRLYEISIDLLCGGWDLAKGIARGSTYGSRLKWTVLMRLAMSVHESAKRLFDEPALERNIVDSLSVRTRSDWRLIRDELVQDRLIIRAGEEYSFPHLSFQEYLAARDLMTDPAEERRSQILLAYLDGDDWWREVLIFYVGMCSNPPSVRTWASALIASNSERMRRFEELCSSAPGFYPDIDFARI